MEANQTLENIAGGLKAYSQLVPGTFQHVDQLTQARIGDPELCTRDFYTADGHAFKYGPGNSVLWGITREPNNLILKHLNLYDEKDGLFGWVVYSGNNSGQIISESADDFKEAEVFDLTEFRLEDNNSDCHFLRVRTADGYVSDGRKFVPPNIKEQKALSRLGFTDDYLNFLANYQIENTGIFVLTQRSVRKKVGTDGIIWLASSLNEIKRGSLFYTETRDIYIQRSLRGCQFSQVYNPANKNFQ